MLAGAGCGGDDNGDKAGIEPAKTQTEPAATPQPKPESEKRKVVKAVEGYLAALANRDASEACSRLDGSGQGVLAAVSTNDPLAAGASCEKGAERVIAPLDSKKIARLKAAKIGRVTIRGKTAKARLRGGQDAFELAEDVGEWKVSDPFAGVSSLIGTVYPSG